MSQTKRNLVTAQIVRIADRSGDVLYPVDPAPSIAAKTGLAESRKDTPWRRITLPRRCWRCRSAWNQPPDGWP